MCSLRVDQVQWLTARCSSASRRSWLLFYDGDVNLTQCDAKGLKEAQIRGGRILSEAPPTHTTYLGSGTQKRTHCHIMS